MKLDSYEYNSEKKKSIIAETDVDWMSRSCRWCTIIDDPRKEAGVVIGVSETLVFQNIRDQIVPVLRRLPLDV